MRTRLFPSLDRTSKNFFEGVRGEEVDIDSSKQREEDEGYEASIVTRRF